MTFENTEVFNLGVAESVGGLKKDNEGNITVANLAGDWSDVFPQGKIFYLVRGVPSGLWCDHTTNPSRAVIAAASLAELDRLRDLMFNPRKIVGVRTSGNSFGESY